VFPVRYELKCYISFTRNKALKVLNNRDRTMSVHRVLILKTCSRNMTTRMEPSAHAFEAQGHPVHNAEEIRSYID
jgi:hypothetical protein